MKEITITNEKFSNPLETNEVNVKVEPQMEEVNAIDCNKFANKTTGKSNSDMEATAHKVASDVIKAGDVLLTSEQIKTEEVDIPVDISYYHIQHLEETENCELGENLSDNKQKLGKRSRPYLTVSRKSKERKQENFQNLYYNEEDRPCGSNYQEDNNIGIEPSSIKVKSELMEWDLHNGSEAGESLEKNVEDNEEIFNHKQKGKRVLTHTSELLEKLRNINDDCSDIETNTEFSSEDNEETSDTGDSDEEFKTNEGQEIIDNEENFETMWSKLKAEDIPVGVSPAVYIYQGRQGPTDYAKKNIMLHNPLSAFSLLLDDHIIKYIKKCTELEGKRVLGNDWCTTLPEIRAFMGLLYAFGAYEAKNNLNYLWSPKWGPEFFRSTMAQEKFQQILHFIRFDKRNERCRNLQGNKLTLISSIWNKFMENSQTCYQAGENITIGEQFFPTISRCKFLQYMPKKSHKFGIKFWLAADVRSKYVLNGFPYVEPLSENILLKLIEPYTGCGRNVINSKLNTNLSLAAKLLAQQTTLVGGVKENQKGLPKSDNMPCYSSLLYKRDNCILTIYKSKSNKKLLVLSSKHQFVQIDKTNKEMLPESIQLYKNFKFTIDKVDKMARKYSVKACSHRWPLQIFFNILDLAGINAWILYKEITGLQIQRKEFLFQLAEQLCYEYRLTRQTNLFDYEESSPTSSVRLSSVTQVHKRKICQIRLCHNNKTNNICGKCQKYVCGKCTKKKFFTFICIKCSNSNNSS
ncbi:piggyBac transposable element-derived protein 4-like isoform 1-T1 [Cochliomyia hominivorax]